MSSTPRRRPFLCRHPTGALALALVGACVAPDDADPADPADEAAPAAAARAQAPSPGSPSIGDPLYETLGNGGYDALHYDLDLRYATSSPSQAIDGTVTILARATQALSSFDLDFGGDAVGEVTVDGCQASWFRDGDELVITPARPLRNGEIFVVRVAHFAATPGVPDPADFLGAPFFVAPDGSAWAGQPDGAHRIFPSNDHPRDLATFSFRLDVPAGTTAVANGVLVDQRTAQGRTVSRYVQLQPMATELTQVAVGDLTVIDRGRHAGVHIRDVVPTRLAAELGPKLAIVTTHLDWLAARLGRYPFDTYGSLAVDTSLGFALETQTLSLYEVGFFAWDEASYAPIMVHELAHQWFGDSVAPANWSDVWQNEGHATWYELTYQYAPDSAELTGLMQQVYTYGDYYRAWFGAVGTPRSGDAVDVFNPNVYYGGALVLYALRQQVGDASFQAIERAWVRTYRGKSASSADFIALASRVSGQDLTAFLNAWLYDTTTPPMPGHPEWTVEPVPAMARLATPSAAAAARLTGLPPTAAAEIHDHQVLRR